MTLLSSLPPLPARMQSLPIDARGYPVPWFVAWLDDARREVPPGSGKPDFRVIRTGAIGAAYNHTLCWICGERRGTYGAFVVGPMCAVNRISAEPPSHLECADFAARACPFLVRPHMRRREAGLPEERHETGGIMLLRNPGVALVYTTKHFKPELANGGVVFDLGEPEHVRWYCEGRPATRAEVSDAIAAGIPLLDAVAESDDERRDIVARVKQVQRLLPLAAEGDANAG